MPTTNQDLKILLIYDIVEIADMAKATMIETGIEWFTFAKLSQDPFMIFAMNKFDYILFAVREDFTAAFDLAKKLRDHMDETGKDIPIGFLSTGSIRTFEAHCQYHRLDVVASIPSKGKELLHALQAIEHGRPASIRAANYYGPDRRFTFNNADHYRERRA